MKLLADVATPCCGTFVNVRIKNLMLVGMGVLPCNFKDKADYDKVKDLADATFGILPYVLAQILRANG